MDFNPIKEFYRDQEIFITGATGLIGKSLIEKLLRSFPEVKKIYILLREKRGKTIYQRMEAFKNNGIFALVRENNPEAFNKIIPIRGDIIELGLGISSNDLKLLENVSIVFHVAATIRFDEPLKKAILQNTRATREALKIAESLKNIKKFVHVSTAYSNPYEPVIKEELYPPCADWEILIKAAEKFDTDTLDAIMPKLINKFPNSYTFSKNLAEHVVNSYKNRLPVIIYRPSIVCNSYKEPFKGWYDAFTGATGLIAVAYTGLARVVHCRSDNIFDLVPLDVTSIFLIACAWKDTEYPPVTPEENTRVYNLIGTNYRAVTAKNIFNMSINLCEKIPFMKCVWYPRLTCIENKLYFMLNFYIFHLLPAIILDGIIKLTGNKPFVIRVQRKYLATLNVFHFFMHNDYKFENAKTHNTIDDVVKHLNYPVGEMFNTPTVKMLQIGVEGVRKYLFKDSDEDYSTAYLKIKILKYLDMFVRYYFYYWLLKTTINFLLNYFHFV